MKRIVLITTVIAAFCAVVTTAAFAAGSGGSSGAIAASTTGSRSGSDSSGGCTGTQYVYGADPSPGWFTFGQRVSCQSQIASYDMTICIINVATGQDLACHRLQGQAGWAAYSVSQQYTFYDPGTTAYASGRWTTPLR